MIYDQLKQLSERDTYSLLLFALYKITENPEYASICELIYTLDKPGLFKLCEYFGGQTIKIPTLGELEVLLKALMLISYTKIDKITLEEALEKTLKPEDDVKTIKNTYKELLPIIANYDFRT